MVAGASQFSRGPHLFMKEWKAFLLFEFKVPRFNRYTKNITEKEGWEVQE